MWFVPRMWKPQPGMILPDDHIAGIADAAHKAGAIFVLDLGGLWRALCGYGRAGC